MPPTSPTWGLALLGLVLVGCDDTAFPARPVPQYEPTWTDVQAFTVGSCVGCHAPGLNDVELPDYLEDDHHAGVDRNVPNGECDEDLSGMSADNGYLVVPCNPEASEFWRVLSSEDRRTCGAHDPDAACDLLMPATGELADDEIEFVREWILQGAPL